MAKTGIAANVWKDQQEMTGYQIAPALSEYDAEIYEVSTGMTEKRNPPEPYVIIKMHMEHPDMDRDQINYSEFFALTEERLGFLKAFLLGIGRADMMSDDGDWDDLSETQFRCDVKHTTGKNGQIYANLDLNTLQAQSHDIFEIPVEEPKVEEPVAEEPKKKSRPRTGGAAPRRSPRARAER